MNTNYWIKDQSRKEIITQTQLPNSGNFSLFANYYNLIDKQGLSFQLNLDSGFPVEKLFRKNNFDYFILKHNNSKELYILPNENITNYTNRIVSKIDFCDSENAVLNLLIEEMK